MNQNSQVNILLVDDQPAKLLSYEAILGGLGENLVKANSGREALKHLMTSDIAVVLLDVCMPDMDGFELATLIREHPRFRKTAIILISAIAQSDFDRLRGYDSGAVDYVPVPVVPEVLRAKVAVFAELYRKSEELRRLNVELEERVAERTRALEESAARLRENEERLRIALDTGRLGAWELDLASARVQLTPLCQTQLGLPAGGPVARESLFLAISDADREMLDAAMDGAVRSRTEFEVEVGCGWPDGSIHRIVIRGRPLSSGEEPPARLIGVTLDVTDRRNVEEERALLLDSERVARLEAERAARAKDEFLAVLSHELRTPLHAILGWLQILRRSPRDPQTVDDGLETIERNARGQARLIEDLLDVSRVISGKIHLDRGLVNLAATLDRAVESVKLAAQTKNISIRVRVTGSVQPVEGDGGRLQQVISNLLSNAIKFSARDGRIVVELEDAGSHVELRVIDQGDGIDPEFLPHVFDRFRQADSSTTRRHGGLGLGLSIARHLVELHGGTIRADSNGRGHGSTFTIRLPGTARRVSDTIEYHCEDVDGAILRGARLLVVDDDPDSCTLMQRMLSDSGAEVEIAHSARSAMQMLEDSAFDALLSDIGMPEENGLSLIRRVRQLSSATRDIPAIAVTAFVRSEERLRALEAGYNLQVGKPVNYQELMGGLVGLLRGRQQASASGSAQTA